MQRRRQRQHATIRQGRNNKATVVALVLVAEGQGAVRLLHDALAELALVLLEIQPQLAQPLEVVHVAAAGLDEALHDVAVVQLNRDERHQLLAHDLLQRLAHDGGQAVEVLVLLAALATHGRLLAVGDGEELLGARHREGDHARRQQQLAGELLDPALLGALRALH